MEAAGFYETLVNIYHSTRRHITEDGNIHTNRTGNSRSNRWNADLNNFDARTANGPSHRGKATRLNYWGMGGGGSLPNMARDILFVTVSTVVLGPTHLPVQQVPRPSFQGIKRPEREANHSPLSVLRLRMCGTILPLPNTSSWHVA